MTTVPAAKCDKTSWPPGNKKAKDDCAQELKDTKWKDDLVKVNHDLAKHSQSQAAIFAEQKDMLVAMLDEATMLIDLDNIPEGKREFFEWRQQKVMEKMMKAKAVEAQKKKEEEEKKNKEEEEEEKKIKMKRKKRKKKTKKRTTKAAVAAEAKRRVAEAKKKEQDRWVAEAKKQEEDMAGKMILEVGDAIETDEEEEGEGEDEDNDDDEEDEEGEIKIGVKGDAILQKLGEFYRFCSARLDEGGQSQFIHKVFRRSPFILHNHVVQDDTSKHDSIQLSSGPTSGWLCHDSKSSLQDTNVSLNIFLQSLLHLGEMLHGDITVVNNSLQRVARQEIPTNLAFQSLGLRDCFDNGSPFWVDAVCQIVQLMILVAVDGERTLQCHPIN
ncbi:hypothetical protein Pst134EB_001501 [Puccinia striiformis f. sp. tritici]|nr:hypothetical protein Pst134EB_001501 [Puccinia striiformis f. sp. tritici]